MKTTLRSRRGVRDPLPQRAAAAFDRFTGAAAPHALLLVLALITVAILQRV